MPLLAITAGAVFDRRNLGVNVRMVSIGEKRVCHLSCGPGVRVSVAAAGQREPQLRKRWTLRARQSGSEVRARRWPRVWPQPQKTCVGQRFFVRGFVAQKRPSVCAVGCEGRRRCLLVRAFSVG